MSTDPSAYLKTKKSTPAPRVSRMQAGQALVRVLTERTKEAVRDQTQIEEPVDVFRDAQSPADTIGTTSPIANIPPEPAKKRAPRKPGVQRKT